jgi:hypothetical protein
LCDFFLHLSASSCPCICASGSLFVDSLLSCLCLLLTDRLFIYQFVTCLSLCQQYRLSVYILATCFLFLTIMLPHVIICLHYPPPSPTDTCGPCVAPEGTCYVPVGRSCLVGFYLYCQPVNLRSQRSASWAR